MNFAVFAERVKVLGEEESAEIRRAYVAAFVDTSSDHYKKYVEHLTLFKDGWCYTGYLQDCLAEKEVMPFRDAEDFILSKQEVSVLWDVNSSERVLIPDYWKFEKTAVIKAQASDLMQSLKHLPEDIYVFDGTYSWTIALTHTEVDERKLCYRCHSRS